MIAKYDIWNKMLNIWLRTSDNKLLEFLACTENADLIKNYLDLITSPTYITKTMDRIHVFYFIVARHINNNVVLTYILDNFQRKIPK